MFTWIAAKLGSTLAEYLVSGVVVLLLAGGGYYTVKYAWYSWFERPKLEKEIKGLQEMSIKYQAQVYRLEAEKQDQKVVIKYREKKTHETSKIDAAANADDTAGMDAIFTNLGMLPPSPAGPAKTPGGSPGH